MDFGAEKNDISKYFAWNLADDTVARQLIKREETPEALTYFAEHCSGLTDYGYWFMLSTLWVSYTGFTELSLWKKLLSDTRGHREACIMKPSELRPFKMMPYNITAYRAHRKGETDWIAYTMDLEKAKQFANQHGVHEVKEYRIRKKDVLAYFTRRGESEILVLDKEKPEYVRSYYVAGSLHCEFCENEFATERQCGNTCCEECCKACNDKYPDNPCRYRAEHLECREIIEKSGGMLEAAELTATELEAIAKETQKMAAESAGNYTAEEAGRALRNTIRTMKARLRNENK